VRASASRKADTTHPDPFVRDMTKLYPITEGPIPVGQVTTGEITEGSGFVFHSQNVA